MAGKTVLAIVSSPRVGGNSEALVDRFVAGAAEAGNAVEKICLRDLRIAPCLACEACLSNGGTCVQKDDMAGVLDKIVAADVIVLSTPVYYYSISAQLKTMIDRTLAGGSRMSGKQFYLITTAADGPRAQKSTLTDMEGFVRCVPGSRVMGRISASAFHIGDIADAPELDKAYRMGLGC